MENANLKVEYIFGDVLSRTMEYDFDFVKTYFLKKKKLILTILINLCPRILEKR